MAFTFLKAQGKEIGRSLLEEDRVSFAGDLLEKAAARNLQILLPRDVIATEGLEAEGPVEIFDVNAIPERLMGLDIGPLTAEEFSRAIEKSRTVLWNGPMGVFEKPLFAEGTRKLAESLAAATERGCLTVVGGGDTAAAVNEMGFSSRVSHVSTGGGASLEFFEGLSLPGIEPFISV